MDENIGSFLSWSKTQLTRVGILSPQLDSEILMSKALSVTREKLLTNLEKINKV